LYKKHDINNFQNRPAKLEENVGLDITSFDLSGENIWKPWRLTAPDGQFLLDESEIEKIRSDHFFKDLFLLLENKFFFLNYLTSTKINWYQIISRDELPVLADYWQIADEFNNNFWSGDTPIADIEAQTEKDFILHGSSLFPTFKKFSNLGEFPSDDLRDCLIPIPANFKEYTADNRKKLIEETILELMDVDKMIGYVSFQTVFRICTLISDCRIFILMSIENKLK